MRALQKTVEQVLNTTRNGSRTLVRDENTLLLYDNEFLPQSAVQLILKRCPLTDVSVQQCEASSSGYIVQFTVMSESSPLASAAFMYLLQCALLVLVLHATGFLDVFLLPSL